MDTEEKSGGKTMFLLRDGPDGLVLTVGDLSLRADFSSMKRRIARHNLSRENAVRACALNINLLNKSQINMTAEENAADDTEVPARPVILDATAGLGEDSFLLAAAGAEVHLYERDPLTAALLRDSLERARKDPDPEIREAALRMHFHEEDSLRAMKELSFVPDVVYLDPMFPERMKSGLVKKKAQILQALEKPCSAAEEEELIESARKTGAKRIVVKRPLKGPVLAGRKPDYSLDGSVVRHDVYRLIYS